MNNLWIFCGMDIMLILRLKQDKIKTCQLLISLKKEKENELTALEKDKKPNQAKEF